jgi:ABC-type glycerol-3-phosphate transport system substrate-binding protein
MKKFKLIALTIIVGALLSACSMVMPVTATSNPVGSKVGTSQATVYLYCLSFDQDASIQKAAKSAGITKISTVDIKTFNILYLYTTYETIVTGE